MSQNTDGGKKLLAFTALVSSILLAVIRTAIIINNMEKTSVDENAYYLPATDGVIAFGVMAFVFCAAMVVISFFIGRKKICTVDLKSSASASTSLIYAFTLVFLFAVYVYFIASQRHEYTGMECAVSALALLSALYFLLSGVLACRKTDCSAEKLALPALLPVFYCAIRLLNDFLKKNSAPMESSGAYHILSLAAVMLFFFVEGRSLIKPTPLSVYLICGVSSLVLLIIYALPDLIVHGSGLLEFDYYTFASIADLCVAGYICSRMITCKALTKPDRA